jgi:hypothetical protein
MNFRERVWGGKKPKMELGGVGRKKTQNGAWGYLLPLNWRFTIRRWLRMRPKLLPKPLQQRGMVLFHMLRHGWYAIGLTICDEAFATPCAQGHNFEVDWFSMANNASNDLALFPINLLIVVYLEERPNGWGPLVRLPPNKLLLHCFINSTWSGRSSSLWSSSSKPSHWHRYCCYYMGLTTT